MPTLRAPALPAPRPPLPLQVRLSGEHHVQGQGEMSIELQDSGAVRRRPATRAASIPCLPCHTRARRGSWGARRQRRFHRRQMEPSRCLTLVLGSRMHWVAEHSIFGSPRLLRLIATWVLQCGQPSAPLRNPTLVNSIFAPNSLVSNDFGRCCLPGFSF